MQNVTVELAYPIEWSGQRFEKLTFRRMKARDALIGEGDDNQTRVGYKLFGELAGVPWEVIGDLDIDDLQNITEKVKPLMGKLLAAAPATIAIPSDGET